MADTQNEVSETLVIPTVSTNESVADGSGEDVKVPECPNCNADYKDVIDQIKEAVEEDRKPDIDDKGPKIRY